jgi:poly(3-hydroxybutyrate) depolymerase
MTMKLLHHRLGLMAALSLWCGGFLSGVQAAPTFTAIGIGTNGTPRGYWEFLPTAYASNPTQKFPVVFYFHGLGEGGAGTVGAELNKVLVNEVAKNLNTANDPIRNLMDQQGVIVLCPQITANNWWGQAAIRSFMDYALTRYQGRLDTRRIYLTGLSSGSQGVTDFMNVDANAEDMTAGVVCAYRGMVPNAASLELVKRVPYWVLTARGDLGDQAATDVTSMATSLKGSAAPSPLTNYPGNTVVYSAKFSPVTNWTWVTGVDPADGVNPKLTYFVGSNHNSWNATYTSTNMWTWMLAQQKPDLTVSSPTAGQIIPSGSTVTLAATAMDRDGAALTGSSLQWTSSLDGALGVGTNLNVNNLSVGSHVITCRVVDGKYRGNRVQVQVTVPYAGSFTTRFDFGTTNYLTTAAGWNNLTNLTSGLIDSAVNTAGNPVGVRLQMTQGFEGSNDFGVVSSALYPDTAQRDSMYVSSSHLPAQLLVSGLNPAQFYDFIFFGSRDATDNRTTVYTINGVSVSLNAAGNTNQTVALNNVKPDAQGRITVSVAAGTGASFGYLNVLTITTAGPVQTPLQVWRALQGLAANGSGDLLTPAGDGVANLLKFAFNLAPNPGDLNVPNARVMTSGGSSGLPLVQPDGANHLTLTFVRRKAESGVTYAPEGAGDLRSGWSALTASPVVTSLDSTWERVTYTDAELISASSKRFLRVRVYIP